LRFLTLPPGCPSLATALFIRTHFSTQYCHKKTLRLKGNFEPQVSFGQGKLLAQGTLHSFLSLPWLGIETYDSKIYFIAISFFRNIVC